MSKAVKEKEMKIHQESFKECFISYYETMSLKSGSFSKGLSKQISTTQKIRWSHWACRKSAGKENGRDIFSGGECTV